MDLPKIKDIGSTIKIDPRFEKLPFKKLIIFSFISNLFLIVLSILSTLILPPKIPLFFGLPQSEEMLTSSLFLIIPSIIASILVIINSFIAIKIKDVFIKKALAFATFSVSLLSFIATIKIIFLMSSL